MITTVLKFVFIHLKMTGIANSNLNFCVITVTLKWYFKKLRDYSHAHFLQILSFKSHVLTKSNCHVDIDRFLGEKFHLIWVNCEIFKKIMAKMAEKYFWKFYKVKVDGFWRAVPRLKALVIGFPKWYYDLSWLP